MFSALYCSACYADQTNIYIKQKLETVVKIYVYNYWGGGSQTFLGGAGGSWGTDVQHTVVNLTKNFLGALE